MVFVKDPSQALTQIAVGTFSVYVLLANLEPPLICACNITTQQIGMNSFQHIPLDRSKECIRLLRFMDRPPSSELEHFALETYDVATAPPFVALSYTWGNPEPTHDIIVDRSRLPIRENLYVVLKVLRSFFLNQASFLDKPWQWVVQENGYPLMWIDAVCINQSDHLEKNHQVNMMGRIYSTAERVISWLGDEADNSSRVMAAIKATRRTWQYDSKVEQAMDAFVKRPYWHRMWVIQEFVLPQDLVLLCGHKGVWWEDLHHFWHDKKLVYGANGVYRSFSGNSVQSVGETGLAALIFARSSRRGEYDLDLQKTSRPISVENIMARFTYGGCSDPRDRIYALLALIEPQAGVEPILADYTISAEVLYYRVLGSIGPLEHGRRFRRRLREALDSSSWADAEAAKLHEVVYQVAEMGAKMENRESRFSSEETNGFLLDRVRNCLITHLERRVDGDVYHVEDWTYDDIIRRFEGFPRGEDPRTWQQFDYLVRLSDFEVSSEISQ